MKKTITLLFHLVSLICIGQNTEVPIGNPGGSNGNENFQFIPTTFQNAKTQTLMLNSELTNGLLTVGSEIVGLQWNVVTDNTNANTTFSIYIDDDVIVSQVPTTPTNNVPFVSSNPVLVGSNLVDSGQYTGWHTAMFTTPFIWDGTDNLIIQMCRTGGGLGISDVNQLTGSPIPLFTSGYNQNCSSPTGFFGLTVRPFLRLIVKTSTLLNTVNAPSAPSPQIFCSGATVANLTVSGQTGATFNWYDVAVNGSALPTSTLLVNGTYYVSQTVNGNESSRIPVTVSLNTTPTPTASAQLFCGSATVAQLQATGTNLKWYNSMGSLLTPSTVLSSGTYFVTQTLNGCESAQTEVLVTINPIPNAPTASDQTFCGTTTVANLQATGENLKWYGVATSGYALSASTVINMTGIYYVSQTVNGCESARIPVLVTNLLPNVPTPIQTVAITPSSFNVDVIVEGSESPYVSSLGTFDGFSARLVASSYSYNNTVVTNSLPDSGFFTSVANTQISYQLQSNKTLNAIQIRNFNETKTATFSSPTLATKLFVLASTGNGNATAEITVNYADGTSEVFSRQISDWYNGTGFAIQGIARVNIFEYQNPFNNPRLYEIELNLQNASPVTSVAFKKQPIIVRL